MNKKRKILKFGGADWCRLICLHASDVCVTLSDERRSYAA